MTGTPEEARKSTATASPTSGKTESQVMRLWKHRPFTRVIRGWKAYQVVRNYVRLNEQEALGNIAYKKNRLRGLSAGEWEILWVKIVLSKLKLF